MNARRQELEHIIDSLKVKEHAYREWLDSEVTKRFMAELESLYIGAAENNYGSRGDTVDLIAIAFARKDERMQLLSSILDWKPQELMRDE